MRFVRTSREVDDELYANRKKVIDREVIMHLGEEKIINYVLKKKMNF